MLTHTPRSPSSSGSLASIGVEAKRRTLKVPIRLMAMMTAKGSSAWGPREPAIFCAKPVPAQQTQMRRPPSASAAASHRRLDLVLLAHVAGREGGAQLVGQRLALLGVDVGDRQRGALRVQAPRGRLAQPGGAADDQCSTALDVHGAPS